ncbi:MAG: ABC transporter substrate-binding protein [Rhodospirillales bacterium]|nr:ABC transporter substrate-binding protein [Rhodospirillales bacterium]
MKRSFTAAALAAAFGLAAGAAHAQDIAIGYNSDMSATGSAEFGISSKYGIELAVDDLNRQGGLLGHKVVAIYRDDFGQPPKAIQNANELIDNEHVVLLLGAANSGNVLAWMHIPEQKKIPVISPIGTATAITQRYMSAPANFMFRDSMVDRDQISLILAYAIRKSPAHKIAFIVDTTGYGQQALKDLREVAKLYGFKAVAEEQFGPKDTDMTSQLSKIKAAGAEVLITYALSDANGQVMRSLEKISYFPAVVAPWADINTPFKTIAGKDLASKAIFTASVTADSSPAAAALNERLLRAHPDMPTFVSAAQAYDAVMIFAAAVKQAGTTDGATVQQVLENLDTAEGVVKTYHHPFSHTNHEALNNSDYHFAQWVNDRIIVYKDAITESIRPEDLRK